MGALFVVGCHPFVDDFADFAEGGEHVRIEDLAPEGPVEAFNLGVLRGFAGLDVMEPHAVGLGPGDYFRGVEFRSVVDADLIRQGPALPDLVEHPDDPLRGQRTVDFDGQSLARAFVDDVEGAEVLPAEQRIVHEVHGPHPVRFGGNVERLADPFRQPPFGPAWQIELHGSIDTQDALVVPAAAPLAQPVEALPEPPAAVPADNLVESPDDLGVPVIGGRGRSIPRGAADFHQSARPRHGKVLFPDEPTGRLVAVGWRQSFSSRSSLSAWFSIARSAYTRLSLACSPSSSRPRVSNDNPHAESLFRTLKHHPSLPAAGFATLEEARAWTHRFVQWYNHEHLHSSLRFVTPAQKHAGEDAAILARRAEVYRTARARHPERWNGRSTRNWSPVRSTTLNPVSQRSLEPIAKRAA